MEGGSKIAAKEIQLPASNDGKTSYFVKQADNEPQYTLTTPASRRLLTSLSVMDISEERLRPNARKLQLQQSSINHSDLKRAPAMKSVDEMRFKSQLSDRAQGADLNDNLIKLKTQQMAFKIKTKIGIILKEINVPIGQLNSFTGLRRIDEMLGFLSERIKERLASTEMNESNHVKLRSKEKEVLGGYEVQIQGLRKKLQDREEHEKTLKAKVKETHSELRELYDRLNQKEKELSGKVTELYQAKVLVMESEKIIEGLQGKCGATEKERNELRHMLQDDSRSTMSGMKSIEEENVRMREELQYLREELERAREKEVRIQQSNNQLGEEVARWRQRFEEVAEQNSMASSSALPKISDGGPAASTADVVALESQNSKLKAKVTTLEQAKRQLQRDLLNYASVKSKFEVQQKSLSILQSDNGSIEFMKELAADLNEPQMQAHYKRKLQVMAKEWKDKLYEVVFNYQDEMEGLRETANRCAKEKEETEQKMYRLANEKYQAENRLIEREKELYQLSKISKNSGYSAMKEEAKEDSRIQETLLTAKQIKVTEPRPAKSQFQDYRSPPSESQLAAKQVSDSLILN